MSTAEVRDIIADGVFSHLPIDGTTPLYRAVDAIRAALTAAGYSVVRDGELDAATVETLHEAIGIAREKAQQFLSGSLMAGNDVWSARGAIAVCNDLDAALRALVGEAK